MIWRRNVRWLLVLAVVLSGVVACAADASEEPAEPKPPAEPFKVRLLSWKASEFDPDTAIRDMKTEQLDPAKTAIVVVDMWDRHWCRTFTQRTTDLVPPINTALDAARKLGIQVVFTPSDVVNVYKDTPQRKAALALPKHEMPELKEFNPPDPPWTATGGCECGPNRPCPGGMGWTRQQAGLRIEAQDLMMDGNNGQELYSLCAERGITTLLYMGVATNMCVINRSVGIRQMTRLGLRCVIVGDVSAAISGNGYDPDAQRPDPTLTPESGTRRVLRHLEQHWCPSIDSEQIIKAAGE